MAYNFKNLNEVERQDKPTENTTVMAFESGNPRQIPASEFGGKGLVVDLRSYTVTDHQLVVEDMSYDPIYEAIMAGKHVVFQMLMQGLDSFLLPVVAAVIPGTGFIAMTLIGTNDFIAITFTNGSYHSAETASE